jgi:hypothetical protein
MGKGEAMKPKIENLTASQEAKVLEYRQCIVCNARYGTSRERDFCESEHGVNVVAVYRKRLDEARAELVRVIDHRDDLLSTIIEWADDHKWANDLWKEEPTNKRLFTIAAMKNGGA